MLFSTSNTIESFISLTIAVIALTTMPTYATKTSTVPPFNLSTPAGTDIWRKPPSHDVFTAPTHPSPLPQTTLTSFQRARLTFSLPPANTLRQYDQAGLVLRLTHPDRREKWIKTGIEWYYGKPYVSTVGADQWADWSVVPLWSANEGGNSTRPTLTVEAKREKDQLGKSLWIYWVKRNEKGEEVERVPLREVNWFFAEEEGWSLGVGGMVARPTKEGGDEELGAEFGEGVEIVTLDYEKQQ